MLPETLRGQLRRSHEGEARVTCGKFRPFMIDNEAVFTEYFQGPLFAGSLNIELHGPLNIRALLDARQPRIAPSVVIPKNRLIMPPHLGDGRGWPVLLSGEGFPRPIGGWIFRRIGSQVDPTIIEFLTRPPAIAFPLRNGTKVEVRFTPGARL